MAEPPDELWRDVSVVLRHIRFIAALFVGAILVAVGTGLVADPENKATSEAEIDIKVGTPLFGEGETVPTLETFQTLAKSDEIATTAAQELGTDPAELRNNITVRTEPRDPEDRESVDRLSVEAEGSSQEEAEAIAGAVIDAFIEVAKDVRSDPQELESLQEQETLARQRLEELDQDPMFELAQVESDLQGGRQLIISLETDLAMVDRARAFLSAEGASRTLPEVLIAIAALLGDEDGGVLKASTVDEIRTGLDLRRSLIEDSIQVVRSEVDDLARKEQNLLVTTADERLATSLHDRASRDLEAADLAAALTQIDVTVTKRGVDSSDGVNWLARLGAAVAFGLVAGVAGAFALESLTPHWRRWRQGAAKSPREEA